MYVLMHRDMMIYLSVKTSNASINFISGNSIEQIFNRALIEI